MAGTQNTLFDLNNILFEQLERLNDDEHMKQNGENEIDRSKAMCGVADKVIQNANLLLKAMVAADERMGSSTDLPRLLGGPDKKAPDKT